MYKRQLLITTYVVRWRAVRRGRLGFPPRELTAWDIAAAQGGVRPLRDVVLADLFANGALDPNGRLTAAAPPRSYRPTTVVGAYDMMAGQQARGEAPHLAIRDMETLAVAGREAEASRQRLAAHGYLIAPEAIRAAGLGPIMAAAWVWWALGFARFVTSVPGSPRGFLLALVLVGPFVAVLLMMLRPKPFAFTAEGRRAIAGLLSLIHI